MQVPTVTHISTYTVGVNEFSSSLQLHCNPSFQNHHWTFTLILHTMASITVKLEHNASSNFQLMLTLNRVTQMKASASLLLCSQVKVRKTNCSLPTIKAVLFLVLYKQLGVQGPSQFSNARHECFKQDKAC